MSVVVEGGHLVLVYREAPSARGTYHLIKVLRRTGPIKEFPLLIADGGLRNLLGVTPCYLSHLSSAAFCYVIGSEGSRATAYSMRVDGSLVCTSIPCDSQCVLDALGSPWTEVAGSDELVSHRPGPKIEVSCESTITCYTRSPCGSLRFFSSTCVPCDRVRLDSVVGPSCFERRNPSSGAVVANRDILGMQSYLRDLRKKVIDHCIRKAQVVVVSYNGSLTRYVEMMSSCAGISRMKPWEGYGDCMRTFPALQDAAAPEDTDLGADILGSLGSCEGRRRDTKRPRLDPEDLVPIAEVHGVGKEYPSSAAMSGLLARVFKETCLPHEIL